MDHVVEVCTSHAVLQRWPAPLRALTKAEQRRARGFRGRAEAADFIAAHLLIRECAGRLLGTPPAQVVIGQVCDRCGGPHGAPFVVGTTRVKVSWGHSAGHVIAAAGARPIGADIENSEMSPRTSEIIERLLSRVGTASESAIILQDPDPVSALLRLWVMKEALVKAGALALDDFGAVELADVRGFTLVPMIRPGSIAGVAVMDSSP